MKRTIVLLWMAPSAPLGSGPVSQRLLHTPALNSSTSMHLSIRLAICFLPQYLCSSLSLFSIQPLPALSGYTVYHVCVCADKQWKLMQSFSPNGHSLSRNGKYHRQRLQDILYIYGCFFLKHTKLVYYVTSLFNLYVDIQYNTFLKF